MMEVKLETIEGFVTLTVDSPGGEQVGPVALYGKPKATSLVWEALKGLIGMQGHKAVIGDSVRPNDLRCGLGNLDLPDALLLGYEITAFPAEEMCPPPGPGEVS